MGVEIVKTSDRVDVVRCRDCTHCFSIEADPLEHYDGEPWWYCEMEDDEYNVNQRDPNRFFCANGERYDKE